MNLLPPAATCILLVPQHAIGEWSAQTRPRLWLSGLVRGDGEGAACVDQEPLL